MNVEVKEELACAVTVAEHGVYVFIEERGTSGKDFTLWLVLVVGSVYAVYYLIDHVGSECTVYWIDIILKRRRYTILHTFMLSHIGINQNGVPLGCLS
jgi:hypothetical protein